MKKKEMQAGVRYRGYGMINEYGEFEFVPEDTGSRKDVVKSLSNGDGYSVNYSKKNLIVHMRIKRSAGWPHGILREFVTKFNEVFNVIKDHEL